MENSTRYGKRAVSRNQSFEPGNRCTLEKARVRPAGAWGTARIVCYARNDQFRGSLTSTASGGWLATAGITTRAPKLSSSFGRSRSAAPLYVLELTMWLLSPRGDLGGRPQSAEPL
jgi:hypothetical protein